MISKLAVLAEGDPETLRSWSGSSKHLIEALRGRGLDVTGRDISGGGAARLAAMLLAWSPNRRRWAARYHFGHAGFEARSRTASSVLRTIQGLDAFLQIGATFDAGRGFPRPGFLYCDSNVRVAARNAPYGSVARLTGQEQDAMARRESSVFSRMSRVFTMSENVRHSFLVDFRFPADRVVTVFAGANLDPETCVPRASTVSGPPTVLFVGRHWEPKGGPELLAAFRAVRQSVPDSRLRIVGCSPTVDEPGVEIIGRLDKSEARGASRLSTLYREADLFCLPSRYDAFGIVFVEAMLHGIACLGSAHAAIPEIIQDGVTGWVVPLEDPRALRDRLTHALANRGELVGMGRRGRARALGTFTWARVAERMIAAFREPEGLGR